MTKKGNTWSCPLARSRDGMVNKEEPEARWRWQQARAAAAPHVVRAAQEADGRHRQAGRRQRRILGSESEEHVDEEEERHKDRRCTQLASDRQHCQHRGGDEVTAHSP